MKTVVSVKDIRQSFGEKTVLQNVNFRIEQGEIFGLLGPSGAGKTTLIKIMTGQLMQTAGEVEVFEKNTACFNKEYYRKIGIMMDSFGLYERLTCYDNLKFYTKLLGISTDKIEEVLKKVGLQDAKKTVAANLSKGMRSRLLLARVLLGEPELLFLDEPTSGLDPATTAEIHRLMEEERKKGTTIFLTTHNMAEAEKLCDNIALLNEGKIVEYGNPGEICRRYNHQKKIIVHLYGGEDMVLSHDVNGAEKIMSYLKEGKLETIHSTEPNLETVFMELTGRGLE